MHVQTHTQTHTHAHVLSSSRTTCMRNNVLHCRSFLSCSLLPLSSLTTPPCLLFKTPLFLHVGVGRVSKAVGLDNMPNSVLIALSRCRLPNAKNSETDRNPNKATLGKTPSSPKSITHVDSRYTK